MKQRVLAFAPVVIALAAAVSLLAQTPASPPASTQEKLYISLETTDTLAVVDLKTFKQIKTLKVGCTRTARHRRPSQDKLYVAAEIGGTVTLIDTIQRRGHQDIRRRLWRRAAERRDHAGRPLPVSAVVCRLLAGVRHAERTDRRIHPHAGHRAQHGDGAGWAVRRICCRSPEARVTLQRPSLGLPRTQPKEVTVVDAQDAQSRWHDSDRHRAEAGHDQPGWQASLHERRRSAGVPRHRHGRAQSHLEGDLHADAGRAGGEKPIARHRRRERRQGSLEQRRRPQPDVRVRRDRDSAEADRAISPSAGSRTGSSRRRTARRSTSTVRAATS